MNRLSLRAVLAQLSLIVVVSSPAFAIETIVGVANRVVDGTTVEIEGKLVRFWGCEPLEPGSAAAKAAATALTELIGGAQLACIQIDQTGGLTTARCFAQQMDLCAAMVRLGHAADSLGIYANEEGRAAKSKRR